MNGEFNIPWRRYALIAELTKRFSASSQQFGKTALQKLVFLLQEIYGADFGYEFELYSYGPFTAELLGDLDVVEQLGAVKIEPVQSYTGGYIINKTDRTDILIKKSPEDFNGPISDVFNDLERDFGNLTARELELRATIVFIERSYQKKGESISKGSLIKIVNEIKPKYKNEEICEAITELSKNTYISLV